MSQCICLSGALTLDTVTAHFNALERDLAQGAVLKVDFSAVTEVDSSAVALLLAWHRQAAEQGAVIQLTALPDGMRKLVAVYGLSELLLAA